MTTSPTPPRITGMGYVRPLGRGGFAHVHLFEQDMPRRQVAVKVLGEGIETARRQSSFAAEADAMARLSNHPSIVSIYGAGISTDGQLYIAMEYCPDSMRDRTRGKPAHLRAVLDAGVRLAGALESAHQSGVLHRDIKPSNVLITTTGRPALTDFGIASMFGQSATSDDARALSLPWAAPEVVSGSTSGTVASEIWSLGATLYTFAAGHSPFEAADIKLNTHRKMSARILKAEYTPVPGASGYEPFDALMAHAMNAKPEDRFPTMRHFAEALQRAQRYYGFDVTQFDVLELDAPPEAPAERELPSRSAVRPVGRAELRAARAGADDDGVLSNRRDISTVRAGLIGAGIGVGVVAVAVVAARLVGWF